MSEKIVFMGTPDFAVASLNKILESKIEVAAVVTVPDKPAGRGQKINYSAVKTFALEKNLKVLQPISLKDEEFIQSLKSLNADLFVVVAFRMLPEVVWTMPPKGTINLHGSLLPDYRGAAPINWAIINGEKETGVTTFFIEKEIDTGKIIDSAKIKIEENDDAGKIHDQLMEVGADLLVKTIQNIFTGNIAPKEQIVKELKEAPKIFKPDCKINWHENVSVIYNKIRGLSPYPAAWTEIKINSVIKSLKIFKTEKILTNTSQVGLVKIEAEVLLFGCKDGWISIIELQLEGKKRMPSKDFIKGLQNKEIELV